MNDHDFSPDVIALNPELSQDATAVTLPSNRKRRYKDWKAVLEQQMTAVGLPEPEREYLFHEDRKWRFDYCWVVQGIALEYEGGIWLATETGRSKGHAHPARFLADCEKYNEAALYGWRVLRVTSEMVKDGRAVAWLERALIKETHER
jgi:hypothetical protein